ncbi:MAG: hypothetical protein WDN48_00150 [Pseudolabrys sp.]
MAIARYVYPGQPLAAAAIVVEAGAYYMDPQARLDAGGRRAPVEWYKAQGLVDKSADARAAMDLSFIK